MFHRRNQSKHLDALRAGKQGEFYPHTSAVFPGGPTQLVVSFCFFIHTNRVQIPVGSSGSVRFGHHDSPVCYGYEEEEGTISQQSYVLVKGFSVRFRELGPRNAELERYQVRFGFVYDHELGPRNAELSNDIPSSGISLVYFFVLEEGTRRFSIVASQRQP